MPYFGIDLGTTNSVVAYAQKLRTGEIKANAIEIPRFKDRDNPQAKEKILPSCVYYPLNGKVVVGDFARTQYTKDPERVVRSVKSLMGKPTIGQYADSVTDRTPEDVSARILYHLKRGAESYMRQANIGDDVIITIPASFDPAQKDATMLAAQKAGFNVTDADGKYRAILISEPNAVLYDVVNQYQNGEIPEHILDFKDITRVLVFDIGGGTLDVTFQEVIRDSFNQNKLNISEIATSRYTRLAGDDFDLEIATALYERCINYYQKINTSFAKKLRNNREYYIKRFLIPAEKVKCDISHAVSMGGEEMMDNGGDDDWFSTPDTATSPKQSNSYGDPWFFTEEEDNDKRDETAEEEISAGVDVTLSQDDGIFYHTDITRTEFEKILAPLLGKNLTMEDVGRANELNVSEVRTVIAPVLNVLFKAKQYYGKRGVHTFNIDAVILNGGMSRLYLIQERVKEFFGIEPITVNDPDLSVAHGAAIYAYYTSADRADNERIEIIQHLQNESLWLGMRRGSMLPIIEEGTVLPCEVMIEKLTIAPQTRVLEIPIKHRMGAGDPKTFARGKVTFSKQFTFETYLTLQFTFAADGQITMQAILFQGNGRELDKQTVSLAFGEDANEKSNSAKIAPKEGAILHAYNEMFYLKDLYNRKDNSDKIKSAERECAFGIIACGNPKDFSEPILKDMATVDVTDYYCCELSYLCYSLAPHWTQKEQEEVVTRCRGYVKSCDFKISLNASARTVPMLTNCRKQAQDVIDLLTGVKGADGKKEQK